ncbi:LLM class flavin-dependent oxidoreductase [Trujillonella humicola]|uniref:LLM class flavin-dependent oxidoreductase n=1 Tax=Trujillonella humicola TaxID=3383699 RepID=UPI003905840A
MRFGVHLPVADLGGGTAPADVLRACTARARDLGFDAVAASDHLVWHRDWLDAVVALAAVAEHAGDMALVTSVALPTVRHPVVLAKALTSLAAVAGGPVVGGVGPGASADDHRAVGVPFEERWTRFDEGLGLLRALVRGEPAEDGDVYPGTGIRLGPLPARPPEIWSGSWGSDARLRRAAAVADGWLASAFNTTPERFAEARARLDGHLAAHGRDPASFPDTLSSMYLHVTEDAAQARAVLADDLGPAFGRDPADLAGRVLVGTPDACAATLAAYADAGVQRVLLWPVRDPVGQLEVFAREVRPRLA